MSQIRDLLKERITKQTEKLIEYRVMWESEDADKGDAYERVTAEERAELKEILDMIESLA